jgi:dipeptide/tripeptide permease
MTSDARACTLGTIETYERSEEEMNPRYIILFAIIVTTVLTTVFSQSEEVGPRQKRGLWMLLAVGLIAFGAVVLIVSVR